MDELDQTVRKEFVIAGALLSLTVIVTTLVNLPTAALPTNSKGLVLYLSGCVLFGYGLAVVVAESGLLI